MNKSNRSISSKEIKEVRKEKKMAEDEIMQEIRAIRAKNAGRFSTEEEFLAYFKQKEEESKKEGWVFLSPGKKKRQ